MATLICFEREQQQPQGLQVLMLRSQPILAPEELVLAVGVAGLAVQATQQFDPSLLTVAVTEVVEYLFASSPSPLCLEDQSAQYFWVMRQLTRMTIPQ